MESSELDEELKNTAQTCGCTNVMEQKLVKIMADNSTINFCYEESDKSSAFMTKYLADDLSGYVAEPDNIFYGKGMGNYKHAKHYNCTL